MFAHPDDLGRMDDFDARVAAAVLLKLFLYGRLVARQKELPDFGILLQRHHRSGDGISRGIIAAHSVEGDPHGGLSSVYSKNLASFVVSTRRTGGVSAHTGAALRALGKLRSMPAVGRLAGAQAHLRGLAFWNSHKNPDY
jgi:hypothetical protein